MPLRPCRGERPWLPSDRSTNLQALLEVDHPLVGTFDDGECTYLFDCLLGDLLRLELWTYVPLTSSDLDFLRSNPFRTPKDLRDWAEAKSIREATRVALSWDGVMQSHADVDDEVTEALDLLLDQFGETTKTVKSPPLRVKSSTRPVEDLDSMLGVGTELRDEAAQTEVRAAVAATSEEVRELPLPT